MNLNVEKVDARHVGVYLCKRFHLDPNIADCFHKHELFLVAMK